MAMKTRVVIALVTITLLGLGLSVRAQEPRIVTFGAPGADMTAGSFNGTYPQALNDAGVIAGAYSDSSNGLHGFVRTREGKIATFDAPGTVTGANAFTNPRSVNLEGVIVGGLYDAENKVHGFRRSPDGQFITLVPPGECTTSQDVGCHGTGAWDVNNFGTIIGPFEDNSGNFVAHTYLHTPDGKFTIFEVPGSFIDATNVYHGFVRNPGQ